MICFPIIRSNILRSVNNISGRRFQLHNNENATFSILVNFYHRHNNNFTYNKYHITQNFRFFNTQQEVDQQPKEQPRTKILKIAIIGTPNTGKSTFINNIVGRKVLAMSKKVHTTRARARAVINLDETQVVFLDTPGLVSQTESEKYELEPAFIKDGEMSIIDSHIIAVMHDVSNIHTRGKLDPKVLRLLNLYPWKHSVLILNKVDQVKKKHYLLELADRLTRYTLTTPGTIKEKDCKKLTEEEVMKKVKKQNGWSYFQQVFMISALEGEGVAEVMEYFMLFAQPGKWLYQDEDLFTDQKPEKIICDAVKAKLLDHLPHETPYKCRVNMEVFNQLRDGTIMSVVKITCPNTRVERMAKRKVRLIAQEAEEEMRSAFMTQVLIRIALETADL